MMYWNIPSGQAAAVSAAAPGSHASMQDCPEFRFAAAHADGELRLVLDLCTDSESVAQPSLLLNASEAGATLAPVDSPSANVLRYCLTVPARALPDGGDLKDDEGSFTIRADGSTLIPSCRVLLRRTAWPIQAALLDCPLRPQTQAAIRWYGWNRYGNLVGLKRFSSGMSGSDVLVFQPMLRKPAKAGIQAWGSFLLVKTGELAKIEKEWKNYRDFLTDRAHPFMGRCEAYLDVQPAVQPDADGYQATIIGSFLGGDLLQVESLLALVKGSDGIDDCLRVLDKLFALLAPWYSSHELKPLENWDKVFKKGGKRGILLFGGWKGEVQPGGQSAPVPHKAYDFAQAETAVGAQGHKVFGRAEYTEPLSWDVDFIKEEHLSHHLLGNDRVKPEEQPGLLHRLQKRIAARFSVTHGDLHPENILADQDNVWLLDFGETGVNAPTLFDFTKLEVFLRLWCLDLSPAAKELEPAVAKFEKGLLDVLLGTSGALEGTDQLALMMGAQPNVLRKVEACITWIRRRATPFTLGSPNKEDYLAVLYLTVLQTLQYAGKERSRLPNYRMLVTLACLLENLLTRLVGMPEEYHRGRLSLDYKHLVTAEWLAAPQAPARVAYLMRRRDGRNALPFLAATRGVMQNAFHHLDVFEHTLLVMANLEQLLRDPIDALCRPTKYERRVASNLRKQGVRLAATRSRPMQTDGPCLEGLEPHLDAIRAYLQVCLDDRTRLLLKWLSLLHDVGKPATRCLHVSQNGASKKVQFRGHEAYSAFLVEKHLEHWFPDKRERIRLSDLIKKHHFHHQRMEQFLGRPAFDKLRGDVLRGDARGDLAFFHYLEPANEKYLPDLPLLLLHGFADVAACAGPESTDGLGKVAELNLVLLAACVRFRQVEPDRKIASQVSQVLGTMDIPPGKQYGQLKMRLTTWVKERSPSAGQGGDATGPSDEAVRAQAKQLAAQLPGQGG